jgi:hypothetical protein
MSKDNPLVQLRNLLRQEIMDFRDNKVGKVLTIIDASISDQEQRNGLKSLMKEALYDYQTEGWIYARIGKVLLEFNSKFGKELNMTPRDLEDLETGSRSCSESGSGVAFPTFFSEN